MKIVLSLALVVSSLFFTTTSLAAELTASVDLVPAGDFTAKTSAIKGKAFAKVKNGQEMFYAKNVIVDLATIKTGVSLRDKHLKKYLEVEKFPTATVLKAQGQNGKGIALIKVRGKKIKVRGQFTVDKDVLKARFPLKLSEIGVEGIRYMGVGVKDLVQIGIEIPVVRSPSVRLPASKKKQR